MYFHRRKYIKKVAVLGAGVIGAQIAAHFINAQVETILYDLPATAENKPNEKVENAVKQLRALKPKPFASMSLVKHLITANYEQHLNLLTECDLVIEAITEQLEEKQNFYQKITPYLNNEAIFVSSTSGISVNRLAEALPGSLRPRFCGMHFFNPPRYMHLVELIATQDTSGEVLNFLEEFLVSVLGKGVLPAADTPNFIANRVGVFNFLAILHHAQRFNMPLDMVDALTGELIGRPKSAVLRTIDVIGLDTFAHMVQTLYDNLPLDPWRRYYKIPEWVAYLIGKGATGKKVGRGVYLKEDQRINIFDIQLQDYRPVEYNISPELERILNYRDAMQKLENLRQSNLPEAQFMWACLRDLFQYCAVHAESMAETIRRIDLAMRWGYGWQQGPFELWQSAGWKEVADWITQDIAAGKTLADSALPMWVWDCQEQGVYTECGAYAPRNAMYQSRMSLPIYKRQLFPELLLCERYQLTEVIQDLPGVRLWHMGDEIYILSFKTSENYITEAVLDGITSALISAENSAKALVIWQKPMSNFSLGLDPSMVKNWQDGQAVQAKQFLNKLKTVMSAIRYSMIPIIAAVHGAIKNTAYALIMHCTRVVASLETYIQPAWNDVSLLPIGGICKEFALRASYQTCHHTFIAPLQCALASLTREQATSSAIEAQEQHLLKQDDCIIMNAAELLYVAKQQALAMTNSCYRPPLRQPVPILGAEGFTALKTWGSEHCSLLNNKNLETISMLAEMLSGGDSADGYRDEDWFWQKEQELFMQLLGKK